MSVGLFRNLSRGFCDISHITPYGTIVSLTLHWYLTMLFLMWMCSLRCLQLSIQCNYDVISVIDVPRGSTESAIIGDRSVRIERTMSSHNITLFCFFVGLYMNTLLNILWNKADICYYVIMMLYNISTRSLWTRISFMTHLWWKYQTKHAMQVCGCSSVCIGSNSAQRYSPDVVAFLHQFTTLLIKYQYFCKKINMEENVTLP